MFITVSTFVRGKIPHASTFLAAGTTLDQAVRQYVAELPEIYQPRVVPVAPDLLMIFFDCAAEAGAWVEIVTPGPDLGTVYQEALKRLEGGG